MGIEIKVNASAQIRELQRRHPYMTPADIAANTGYKLSSVKAALSKGELRKKPKSLAGGALRGPLTAEQVSEKLRVPLSHARRVTGG